MGHDVQARVVKVFEFREEYDSVDDEDGKQVGGKLDKSMQSLSPSNQTDSNSNEQNLSARWVC